MLMVGEKKPPCLGGSLPSCYLLGISLRNVTTAMGADLSGFQHWFCAMRAGPSRVFVGRFNRLTMAEVVKQAADDRQDQSRLGCAKRPPKQEDQYGWHHYQKSDNLKQHLKISLSEMIVTVLQSRRYT